MLGRTVCRPAPAKPDALRSPRHRGWLAKCATGTRAASSCDGSATMARPTTLSATSAPCCALPSCAPWPPPRGQSKGSRELSTHQALNDRCSCDARTITNMTSKMIWRFTHITRHGTNSHGRTAAAFQDSPNDACWKYFSAATVYSIMHTTIDSLMAATARPRHGKRKYYCETTASTDALTTLPW